MTTPKSSITEVSATQANKHVTINDGLRSLEQGARFFVVKDKDLTTPPASPADGDSYFVPSGASSPWNANTGKIAFSSGGGANSWKYVTLQDGDHIFMQDENRTYKRISSALQLAIGMDYIDSVVVATTANITLSGEQTIDGVLTSGSRVLVKNQSTASQNGIYVSAAGAWARATDFNESVEVNPGCLVPVEQGTVNGDKLYMLTTNGPITIASTSLTFTRVGGVGALFALAEDTAPQLGGNLDSNAFNIDLTNNTYLRGKESGGTLRNLLGVDGSNVVTVGASTNAALINGSVLRVATNTIIGSNSVAPDGTLHVHAGTAGTVTAGANYDDLTIESAGNTGLSLLSPNTATVGIAFGDPDDNDVGAITYSHSTNVLDLTVNASARVRIGSASVVMAGADLRIGDAAAIGDAPVAALDVADSGSTVANILSTSASSTSPAPLLILNRNGGNSAATHRGAAIRYQGKSDTGVARVLTQLDVAIDVATNAAESARWFIQTIQAGTVGTRFHLGAGGYMNGATGGDKGAGTFNATAVYDDNVLLSCFVHDVFFAIQNGQDIEDPAWQAALFEKWDEYAPDRYAEPIFEERPVLDDAGEPVTESVVKAILNDGAMLYEQRPVTETVQIFEHPSGLEWNPQLGKFIESRQHDALRKFLARVISARTYGQYNPLTLEGQWAHWRDKGHLTPFPNEATFDPIKHKESLGERHQKTQEMFELMLGYIWQVHQSNAAHEQRLAAIEAIVFQQ